MELVYHIYTWKYRLFEILIGSIIQLHRYNKQQLISLVVLIVITEIATEKIHDIKQVARWLSNVLVTEFRQGSGYYYYPFTGLMLMDLAHNGPGWVSCTVSPIQSWPTQSTQPRFGPEIRKKKTEGKTAYSWKWTEVWNCGIPWQLQQVLQEWYGLKHVRKHSPKRRI